MTTTHDHATRRNTTQGLRDLSALGTLGWQLLAAVLVCFGAGYGIDRLAGTTPVASIVCGALGIAAGLLLIFRTSSQFSKTTFGKK